MQQAVEGHEARVTARAEALEEEARRARAAERRERARQAAHKREIEGAAAAQQRAKAVLEARRAEEGRRAIAEQQASLSQLAAAAAERALRAAHAAEGADQQRLLRLQEARRVAEAKVAEHSAASRPAQGSEPASVAPRQLALALASPDVTHTDASTSAEQGEASAEEPSTASEEDRAFLVRVGDGAEGRGADVEVISFNLGDYDSPESAARDAAEHAGEAGLVAAAPADQEASSGTLEAGEVPYAKAWNQLGGAGGGSRDLVPTQAPSGGDEARGQAWSGLSPGEGAAAGDSSWESLPEGAEPPLSPDVAQTAGGSGSEPGEVPSGAVAALHGRDGGSRAQE